MNSISEIDNVTKAYILETYLRQAVLPFKHKSLAKQIQIECVYCGDKRLKGTLFLTNNNNWAYICWKASCPCSGHAISAEKWLKKVDSYLYEQYIKELYKQIDKPNDTFKNKAIEAQLKAEKQEKLELEEKKRTDMEATKKFLPILIPSGISKIALGYCKKRMIPENVYKKFFVCNEGKYKGRLFIPFYKKDGKISFFQGRSLYKYIEPKYMSKIGNTALYNFDFIDKSKEIVVLEGPIDSMFIENATATCGAGSSGNLDSQLVGLNCFYLFDNDEAGNKKAGQKVREGKSVFIWSKFLNDYGLTDVKDINDVIIKLNKKDKFKFEELRPYFTNILDEFLIYI